MPPADPQARAIENLTREVSKMTKMLGAINNNIIAVAKALDKTIPIEVSPTEPEPYITQQTPKPHPYLSPTTPGADPYGTQR